MVFLGSFIILVIVVIVLLYFKYVQKLHYWQRQGVDSISIWDMTQNLKLQPWGLVINKYYRQMCAENKAFKVIEGLLVSVVVVQDLEAIRDIMITQFDSFPDRGFYVNPRDALSVNLARLDYDLWKPLRQKMSPSFTPAKIRYMYPTLQRVAKQFVEVLKDECQRLANQIEIYDLCARYTTDFIGNVVFGLECNSLHEPNTEFRIEGDKAFYQIRKPYLDLFAIKFSKLMRFFNVRAFDKQSNDFFTRVFKESMELRIKSNERRNDLMDLLVDLKREHEHDQEMPLTLEILMGQVFAFFIGGFETSSCTMSYALYEMAKNTHIQEKAREEIQQCMVKHDNEITHEALRDMQYLKSVLQETLRKYPIVPLMTRICRRTCKIKTTNNARITIKKDTMMLVPIYGVQHNPDIYPHPEQFAPERFTEENNAKQDPCTFLTFGAGPKTCIGDLLGRMQMLLGLALLLSEFKFSVCEKTPKELTFDPENTFLLYVKDGIQLKVEKLK